MVAAATETAATVTAVAAAACALATAVAFLVWPSLPSLFSPPRPCLLTAKVRHWCSVSVGCACGMLVSGVV